MSLTLLSALEQLARYAREEGIPDADIHRAVAAECVLHGRKTGTAYVTCRECANSRSKRNYLRAA